MSRKQHGITVTLALTSGLVGGMVSSQFLVGVSVFAEKPLRKDRSFRPRGLK